MNKLMLCTVFSFLIGVACTGQSKLKSEEVLNHFLDAIGGKERWLALETRVEESSTVEYGKKGDTQFNTERALRSQVDYYRSPDQFVVHTFRTNRNLHTESVLLTSENCSWYYSSLMQSVNFFDKVPVDFRKDYPRTYLMEALNLKHVKHAEEENGMYRVDFKDDRQDGGVQSLYFDKESFLLEKRTYVTKSTMTPWTFVFSDYQGDGSFKEPRKIDLYGGGELFMSIDVKSIDYNLKLNPAVFKSPVPCVEGEMIPLDGPYYLPKAIVVE